MRRIRWGDVLLSSVAAVGWSLIVMAAVAGLGLHLLGVDAAGAGAAEGSLGAMTAAAVVLAIGGTVTPSGDVSVLGVIGTGAETSLDAMPLGVSLAGALVLAPLFLRSLRAARATARRRPGWWSSRCCSSRRRADWRGSGTTWSRSTGRRRCHGRPRRSRSRGSATSAGCSRTASGT